MQKTIIHFTGITLQLCKYKKLKTVNGCYWLLPLDIAVSEIANLKRIF